MRETEFFKVTGQATSTSTGATTEVLSPGDVDRWVQLVLDDSNWSLERCTEKKSRSASGRAAIPFAGACAFWLAAGQGLYVHATRIAGVSSTWSLSVTVCEHAA